MDDFRESLEAEPFALERDEDLIGRGERGGHEHAERGRGVEDAELEEVVGFQALEDCAEAGKVVVAAGEFDFHAREVHFRGDEREVVAAGGQDLLVDGGIAHEHGVHAAIVRRLDTEAAGAVCLRIEVHQEHPLSAQCQRGGQVQGGGGFSHSTLLVGYGDHFHTMAGTFPGYRPACNQNRPVGEIQRRRRANPIKLPSRHRPSVPGSGTAAIPVFSKIHE